jgi:hypothetical protein
LFASASPLVLQRTVGVTSVNPDPARFSFHIGKGLKDSGSGYNSMVMAAVNDCRDQGAHVISMSLGGPSYSAADANSYADVYDAGVLIIAAAANSGSDQFFYPSSYYSVMSVASVMESGQYGPGELSSFSTRNDQVEIAGPGSYVLSTVPGNAYQELSGTSMATPHVAGVAALLISHFPECTNNQIRNAMIHSAKEPPLGDPRNTKGWDKYYGWGLVDAGAAYELLSQGCVFAGGAYPSTDEKLSDQALGGKDQKQKGCTEDFHCYDENPCNGVQKCDTTTNTCYAMDNTVPDCRDAWNCTIDTCDPSRDYTVPEDLCVHTPKVCDDGNLCNGINVCDELQGGACVQETAPVDCSDDDECMINTCNPSTGACIDTQRTCDDNNACTPGDTCNSDTGCVFQFPPLDNCCGNAKCEGDDMQTCPQDCSTSLTTTFALDQTYRGYLGNLFNVATKYKELLITGVGVHCILPDTIIGTVYVWTKTGDFFKDENGNDVWFRKNLWQLVAAKNVTCAGEGQATQVTLDNAVSIPMSSIQAFNIYVLTPNIFDDYPTIRMGRATGGLRAVTNENSYLQIQNGGGNFCASGWCAMGYTTAFSGSLDYVAVDGTDDPGTGTNSPTTKDPTSGPTTGAPTGSPTPPVPTTSAPSGKWQKYCLLFLPMAVPQSRSTMLPIAFQ